MNPPDPIASETYRAWLTSINSEPSPYFDLMFEWYAAQVGGFWPQAQVDHDPDKLFVDVSQAIAQTDSLENSGDIDQGTTVGFDAYSLVDVPVDKALETALFYFGKPLGQREGATDPVDSVFSSSHCKIQVKWGPGNYLYTLVDTGGGVVDSLLDDYSVLVRGNAASGYARFCSFLGPTAGPTIATSTATTSHINILMLTPQAGNKTALRHRNSDHARRSCAGCYRVSRRRIRFPI
jgi:hypothetical protein